MSTRKGFVTRAEFMDFISTTFSDAVAVAIRKTPILPEHLPNHKFDEVVTFVRALAFRCAEQAWIEANSPDEAPLELVWERCRTIFEGQRHSIGGTSGHG